ncbi:hypothetical protein NE237_003081 [Protea cynaroides]|uniref:Exocyst subunit Exo70 family protein n=1 Tax=Protea cynaroides TaxID=273540 RepID=A0A9Q0KGB1_9MAGN|nr:hypothetical protein NE237_003081 [Protea cynaroides]
MPFEGPSTSLQNLSVAMMDENVEQAKSIITKWDPYATTFAKVTSLFSESRSEAQQFLKSVKDLQRAMDFFSNHHSSSHKLHQAQNLMQLAMKRLEKEFYQILSSNRDHLDPESVSARSSTSGYEGDAGSNDEIQLASESINEVEVFSTLVMSDLRSIADCMISAGYTKECIKIYKILRKSIVDEALYNLGIQRLTSSQIRKMEWEVVELKIKSWLNAVNIAVKSLFLGERIVCDNVFTSEFIRESCFSEITKGGAIHLFQFPESVAECHKSPEKIFKMLDLYDAISELWPHIDIIFSFESLSIVRSRAQNSLIKLGNTIRTMLSEFESAIQNDSSKSPVPRGGLHPRTRYVMNYLSFLTDYRGILPDIMADWRLPENTSLPESYFQNPNPNDHPSSALSVRLAWIILMLLCKLDNSANLYKDLALAYLFLANNLQYVMEKVQNSNLRYLLGKDWVSKHKVTVNQNSANYVRIGWSKVISAIPEDSTETTMSIKEVKHCFNNFNSAFDLAYKTQSSWVVTDKKLREEIKVSIAKKIMPAYQAFYGKHRSLLRTVKYMDSPVRFAPNDLGNYLSDLFYDSGASGSASTSAAAASSSS